MLNDPQITQINADYKMEEKNICPQITQNGKDEGILYRGHYVEPERISSDEANMSYKVIYCVATLDPQISQINAD